MQKGSVPTTVLVTQGVPARTADGGPWRLWCDPLTGLVAYPSFAEYLQACLPALASRPLHLAIGDVDDLKEYVSARRSEDPTMFGHLAGNQCMQAVGRATTGWAQAELRPATFALCGTFGGDEVIVAAAGMDHAGFVGAIGVLMTAISVAAPRTCSFSVGSLPPGTISSQSAPAAFRHFIAAVDAALFFHKAELRSRNLKPRGELKDIGDVRLPPACPVVSDTCPGPG